jgi:hypothetical protein
VPAELRLGAPGPEQVWARLSVQWCQQPEQFLWAAPSRLLGCCHHHHHSRTAKDTANSRSAWCPPNKSELQCTCWVVLPKGGGWVAIAPTPKRHERGASRRVPTWDDFRQPVTALDGQSPNLCNRVFSWPGAVQEFCV